jgi:hypothetical protein
VICAQVDGRPMAVTGGEEIQVWDLRTGRKQRTLAAGPSQALAGTVVGGRPVIISGGSAPSAAARTVIPFRPGT